MPIHSAHCSVLTTSSSALVKSFWRNDVPLYYTSKQLYESCLVGLEFDGHCRHLVKISQHLHISPVHLTVVQTLHNGPDCDAIEGILVVHKGQT